MFFADAWTFWFTVPLFGLWLIACMIWMWRPQRRGRLAGRALRFPSLDHLRDQSTSMVVRLRPYVQALRALTIALLIIALARPQTGRTHTKERTEGIDIILAIDTSGSMRALDLDAHKAISERRNRLEVVQSVVRDFVSKRPHDQIGVVVFGQDAYTQCPLTLDHTIVNQFLSQLEIGMAGDSTAIGSAIATATLRLKDSKAKSKVVILLTDGRNNAGQLSPNKAAEVAAAFGIKIYTIGAATRGQAPFLVDTVFGQRVEYQDVQIDEEVLTSVAQTTLASYFRAEDKGALVSIYEQINQLEKSQFDSPKYLEYNEQFAGFTIAALSLLLLEIVLLGTRFLKVP